MQGSAFSADVFSRLMDWALADALTDMHDAFPEWSQYIGELPHFLIYADDLIVFADTEAGLQTKVRVLVQALQRIGLQVNPHKCKVLTELGGGTCPGIWLPSSATPLRGEDRLTFLGIPLGHGVGAATIMAHLLRKASNTFFAFKRLLDDAATPLSIRLSLFESFVTAKWQWAAPAMFPDKRTLRQIEASKNTYLLSIRRVGTDPLMHWVSNTTSRRRGVRLMCSLAAGPDWRRTWLRRFWSYYGHLARCSILHPQRLLLRACSSSNFSRGLKPSWIVDVGFRRLQRVYSQLRTDRADDTLPEMWEILARDRAAWQDMLRDWLRYWLPSEQEPRATSEYLLDRQLVLLWQGKKVLEMFLRPSRDVLEEPYSSGCMHVREMRNMRRPLVLLVPSVTGCQAALKLTGAHAKHRLVVQVKPSDDSQLARSLCLLTLGAKLVSLLQSFGVMGGAVVASPCLLAREIFQETVPLSLLHDLGACKGALHGLGDQSLFLYPARGGESLQEYLDQFKAVGMPQKYLVRTHDFSRAYFGGDFRAVHAAMWGLLVGGSS